MTSLDRGGNGKGEEFFMSFFMNAYWKLFWFIFLKIWEEFEKKISPPGLRNVGFFISDVLYFGCFLGMRNGDSELLPENIWRHLDYSIFLNEF